MNKKSFIGLGDCCALICCVGFLSFFSVNACAQTSVELKQEQLKIEQDIRKVQEILSNTDKDEKQTLDNLQLTKQKNKLRKDLLRSITKQILVTEQKMLTLAVEIKNNENLMQTLRDKYVKNVIYQYQKKENRSWWRYLFSKTSVSQSVRMFSYLNAYRSSLRRQAEEIKQLSGKIKQQIQSMEQEKVVKRSIAEKKKEELEVLKQEEQQLKLTVDNLRTRKQELNQQIREKKKEQQKLKNAIASAIKKEMLEEARRRREEARKMAKDKSTATVKSKTISSNRTTEKKSSISFDLVNELTENFESQKGKMPWPVEGIIASSYGTDIFEGASVSGKNIGTIFRTQVGASVVSIAKGIVSSSILLQGIYTVIIRHGDHYCGYGNLASVAVKKGDIVNESTPIGTVAQSDNGNWGELSIQIATEKGNVNPEQFLRK